MITDMRLSNLVRHLGYCKKANEEDYRQAKITIQKLINFNEALLEELEEIHQRIDDLEEKKEGVD